MSGCQPALTKVIESFCRDHPVTSRPPCRPSTNMPDNSHLDPFWGWSQPLKSTFSFLGGHPYFKLYIRMYEESLAKNSEISAKSSKSKVKDLGCHPPTGPLGVDV